MLTVFPMITELTIAGFMGIPPESEETPAITLKLGRFNILVGANGAGKTTILRALQHFPKLLDNNIQQTLEQNFSPFFNKTKKTIKGFQFIIGYGFSLPIDEFENKIKMTIHLNDKFKIDSLVLETKSNNGSQWIRQINQWHPHIEKAFPTLKDYSSPIRLLHFDAQSIILPSPMVNNNFLDNGRGITEALAEIRLNDPDKMDEIERGIRQIIPNFERIRFKRLKVDHPNESIKQLVHEMIIDMKHARDVPVELVSDGTILIIGLISALHIESSAKILLLDNLDQGLHPTAQGDLVQNLRKILELRPELQIVATTQSPYLVDYCAADEVIVAAYDQDKGTPVYKKMIEHPEYEAAKDVLKLGEFWSFAGEQWVTGKDTKSITEE